MIYANHNNKRIKAVRTGERANCPGCGGVVIAKCGDYKQNHWAHLNTTSYCKYKPMSDFHLMVQSLFHESFLEKISIDSNGEKHIADIEINGLILEVQNSPIDYDEVQKRNLHHKNVVWVLNWETFFGESFKVDEINLQLIRLNHRRKMFFSFKDNAFFVFKDEIFYLCKMMNGVIKIYKRLRKEDFKDFIFKFSFDTINRLDLAIEQKETSYHIKQVEDYRKEAEDYRKKFYSSYHQKENEQLKMEIESMKKSVAENKALIDEINALKEQVKKNNEEKNNLYQIVHKEISLDYDSEIDELWKKIKSLT